MKPLLVAVRDGQDHRMADLITALAEQSQLSAADLAQTMKDGSPLFNSRVWWSRTYLVKAAVLTSPSRGFIRITDRGRQLLDENPDVINNQTLKRYREFLDFYTHRPKAQAARVPGAVDVDQSDDDELDFDATDPAITTLYLALEGGQHKFWWVNQGHQYKAERAEGSLRAPHADRAGRTHQYHTNVSLLRPGDVVLNYANGSLRSVSTVLDPARPSDSDTASEHVAWVEYADFGVPVELQRIPLALRTPHSGPFTRDGAVTQSYLTPIPSEFVRQLLDRLTGTRQQRPAVSFEEIRNAIARAGLRVSERTLRRYHLSLRTRNFVILAGVSGSGKTWLSEAYAEAIGGEHLLVPVAPNWTTNEDLLGYLNPISGAYYHTDFSRFLEQADRERQEALAEERSPVPYHITLDEMNLARVEYYFAKFLSAMEVRARSGVVALELAPGTSVTLGDNVYVVGTVNVDETTHSFADKVYDRAQLIVLDVLRADLEEHLGDKPYAAVLLRIWDVTESAAPFAYRVVDEIGAYIAEAEALGWAWQPALDEQVMQKVLPKIKGADPRIGVCLDLLLEPSSTQNESILSEVSFPLSRAKAVAMRDDYQRHGFVSFF